MHGGKRLPGDRGFFGNDTVKAQLPNYYALNIMLDVFREVHGGNLASVGLEEVWTFLEFISKEVYKPLIDLTKERERWLSEIRKPESQRDDEHWLTGFYRQDQSIPTDMESIDMSLLAGWDLRRLLCFVYGGGVMPSNGKNVYELLLKKYGIQPNNYTTIISLNYDLILEDALTCAKIPWYYPHINTIAGRKRDGIQIIKPHGSLNWLFSGNKPPVSITTDYGLAPVTHHSISGNQFKEALIIPPTQLKQAINIGETQTKEMQNLLSKLWEGMANALITTYNATPETTQVFIIGYSFPPTDHHLRTFFYQLNHKRHFKKYDQVYCCTWADGQEGFVFGNANQFFPAECFHPHDRGFEEFVSMQKNNEDG